MRFPRLDVVVPMEFARIGMPTHPPKRALNTADTDACVCLWRSTPCQSDGDTNRGAWSTGSAAAFIEACEGLPQDTPETSGTPPATVEGWLRTDSLDAAGRQRRAGRIPHGGRGAQSRKSWGDHRD